MQVQRHPGRSIRRLFMLSLMLLGQFLPPLSNADDYNIQSLGKDFIPLSISDSGLILGKDATTGTITTKSINSPGSTITNLGSTNEASQINDSGFVVGHTKTTPTIASLWENGLASLELTRFTNLVKATAINGFNEIAGTRLDSSNSYRRPFHYDLFSGRLTTLGTLGGAEGWTNDLNDSGYMVGSSIDKNGNSRAFRYNSQTTALAASGTLEGYKHSEGWKINDDESIVGWAYNDSRNQAGKRAFYNSVSGNMANLGTLSKDTDSAAKAINNHGLIVGQSIRADDNGQAFLFNTTSADVVIVVVDPKAPATVYAHSTTGSGVLKSSDSGNNWQTINRGLTNLNVNALIIDPKNSQTLYAGTNGGFFKSADGGNNWTFLSGKLNTIPINALYISADVDNNSGRLFAGTNSGIYYSEDRGENWTLSNSSTGFSTYNFINHRARPDAIYAATNRGVYSSTDRGLFWSRQNGQDTTRLLSQRVSAVAIDPNNSDILYAATIGGGVFTADIAAGSLQWRSINDSSLVNLNIYTLLFVDNGGTSTLFAGSTGGLHRREIGSPTWTAASNFGNRGAYSLALGADSSGTTLYASTFDGDIFRSVSDASGTPPLATSWFAITSGVSLADIYALSAIPKDNNDPNSQTHILAGASNGFFKLSYKNPGDSTSWIAPRSGASGMKLTAISYDNRTTPYTFWAASSDRGLLISHDNGDTWSFSNEGLDNWNIYALTVDTTPVTPIVFAATMGGVYRSEDGGRHWNSASAGLNNLPVYSLLLDTSVTPALLYAGTKQGVYRSGDYGRFWIPMNSSIKNNEIVTLHQAQNGALLAGSISGGLFISNDNGQSWQASNGTTVLPVFDLAEDPFQPGSLLAATSKGLHKLSCTTTCSWDPTPFLTDYTIMSVRFDPDNANHIYAGTETNGIQVSTNLGNSWQELNQGITNVTNRMENLNTLLKPEGVRKNWDLQDAVDINNNGEIVGWGYYFDDLGVKLGTYGYLLTPATGTSTVDLVVTQTTQPETVKQGVPFNYRIAVTNLGPDTETSAKLIDWLPPDIIFRVVSTSQGFCEKRPENIVRCELGGIHPGATAYVNISMESPYRDIQIHNIARVKGNERDANPANNTTTAGNTVTIDKCFIATAAYGSFLDPHVTALRAFRDEHLLTHSWGRQFVAFYYRHSPPLASFISDSAVLRGITRGVLAPVVYAVLYPLATVVLMIVVLSGAALYRHRRKRLRLKAA